MLRIVLIAITFAGCGEITDADPRLGRCATSTDEWWPLQEGNWWLYREFLFATPGGPEQADKNLVVEKAPATVFGLAGEQTGIRAWRSEPELTGWRWFTDEASVFSFRRDVRLDPSLTDPPCELGADEDVRGCEGIAPTQDRYFVPRRTRLDYSPDRVCEQSVWEETYARWTIDIGVPDEANPALCPLSTWLDGSCSATKIITVVDRWTVSSIGRSISVPAGTFDNTLCVHKENLLGEDGEVQTYCFARNVGKIYELDEGDQVECLVEYCVAGDCPPSPGGPCDPDELE